MRITEEKIIEFGKFCLDAANKVLRHDGEIVALPKKSVELLAVLVEKHGEIVSKDDLIEKVWENSFVEESVLTQNIYTLRKLFKECGAENPIKTIARRGYVFDFQTAEMPAVNGNRFDKLPEIIESSVEPPFVLRKAQISRKIWLSAIIIPLILVSVATVFYLRPFKNESPKNAPVAVLPPPISTGGRQKSLAVLPFDISDNRESAFSSTFTSDLTTRLGSLNKFKVTPFFIAKDAQRLKSDFVVQGNIVLNDEKFTVEINLKNTANNTAIFTKTFEAAQNNLVQLQDTITNETSNAIIKRLTPDEQTAANKYLPTNLPAYEMYQKGIEIWRKRGDATAYFEKAIELDANFTKAEIGLASAKMFAGKNENQAVQILQKVLKTAPNSAEALATRGFIEIFHENNYAEAEMLLKRALDADLTNVNAHHWTAVLHTIHGRFDEAKISMQTALELDEKNAVLLADLGQIYYFAGETGLAKEYYEKSLAIEKNTFAEKYLTDLEIAPADKKTALQEAKILIESSSFFAVYVNVEPRFAGIRDEPEFQKLLQKINL